MLGRRIDDPEGVDGAPGSSAGLGLLDAVTRFAPAKRTVQVEATVVCDQGPLAAALGTPVAAYEIHMGETFADGPAVFALATTEGKTRPEGHVSANGLIVGTYLHGAFANAGLREAVLTWLAARKGVKLPPLPNRRDPFDRLADALRESMDIDRLRRIAFG
jgi:adenosylcobyric acid synthase